MKRSDRESYWRYHIQGWRDSGLSGVKYCDRTGISRKPFYTWRKRLANDSWLPVELEATQPTGAVRIVLTDAEVVVESDSSPVALRLALDALS